MAVPVAGRLRTCRYWALGPQCPNYDSNGINCCAYGHWDTGTLVSPLEQRGTCNAWSQHGFCSRGSQCWYEHRQTGVTGLYQGPIHLSGFEFETAAAAHASGFDTRNHEALFDLIWATKRVALKLANSFGQPPIPRDPIYPDRYRPSGIGDNTNKRKKKKRKKRNRLKGMSIPGVPGTGANCIPLGRKRPAEEAPCTSPGGKKETILIDLTSDGDEEAPSLTTMNTSAKKHQTTFGSTDHPKLDKEVLVPIEAPRRQHSVGITPTSDPTSALPVTGWATELVVLAQKNKSDNPISDIIDKLLQVKTTMGLIKKDANASQLSMHNLFNTFYNQLDHSDCYTILKELGNALNKEFDAAVEAAKAVDKVVDWLRRNQEPSVMEL